MEKSSHSSSNGDSTTVTPGTFTGGGGGGTTSSNSGGNDRNLYLNHLNKASHKISKPIRRPSNPLISDPNNHSFQIPPPPIPPPQLQPQAPTQNHQPPVYNINKNDFRDVVQRLTGSPAHERLSTTAPPPPPIQQSSKPTSSRLQRIRPPPLAQISNRPPGLPQIGGNLPGNVMNSALMANPIGIGSSGNVFFGGQRQPLSPLPPFPSVHAAAESPVSAYMRYLQTSISSTAPSPRWGNALPPPQPPIPPLQQQNIPPATQTSMGFPQFPSFPASPLPFGCIPSPSGQMGSMSPTVPLPSPKWRSI